MLEYNADTFRGEDAMSPIYPEYVLRWRHVPGDPDRRRESTARIVEWEDGTRHLFVGRQALNLQSSHVSAGKHVIVATAESASFGGAFAGRHLQLQPMLALIEGKLAAAAHPKTSEVARDFLDNVRIIKEENANDQGSRLKQMTHSKFIEMEVELQKQELLARAEGERKRKKPKLQSHFLHPEVDKVCASVCTHVGSASVYLSVL
jgi:hypothetical protein